jgi:pimeloyl-ACP methyl ester carboxylesterase
MDRKPLSAKKRVSTRLGEVAYLDAGERGKPPLLLVHGIPTSSYLWRHVMRFLQYDFHCLAPDLLGLGDTLVRPGVTTFEMDDQAEMLLEFMDALGYSRFHVVCHDQGGAPVQLLVARQPQRIERLVMTNCVCYDNWPVPAIARLQRLATLPGAMEFLTGRTGLFEWLETRTPFSAFRRGLYKPERITEETIREYLRPLKASSHARADFLSFLRAGSCRHTLQAVEGLRRFDKPTAIIWAAEDRYISPSWGRQLYEDIPGASLFELVPFCGHFWQEEKAAPFASFIGRFLSQQVREQAPAVVPRKDKRRQRATA